MPTESGDNFIEGSKNLTTTPMSIFFTLTFPNVLNKTCSDCQEHFLINGYSSHLKGAGTDSNYTYHSHFPSYTYVISRARDISSYFAPANTQVVVEGDPNFLKKYDAYMDEHRIRSYFSTKDNSRVTRPHVHGQIKNIDKLNFNKSLEKSNYYQNFWQEGCTCFMRIIETNANWVYKNKNQDIELYCSDHKTPFMQKKPLGFFDIQIVNNNEAVENYIQKYIDKGGDSVQLF